MSAYHFSGTTSKVAQGANITFLFFFIVMLFGGMMLFGQTVCAGKASKLGVNGRFEFPTGCQYNIPGTDAWLPESEVSPALENN